jgi:hypothetical protein
MRDARSEDDFSLPKQYNRWADQSKGAVAPLLW